MHVRSVIGLGKMGLPIARNLTERGFAVTGYCRSGSPELAAAGGTQRLRPPRSPRPPTCMLSIVPDAAAVEEVVAGPAGTLRGLRPGTVHIEMSTIDVSRKLALRDAVRAAGGDLLDCPISGSPGMVAPRLATTFVSGRADSVDAVRPVLDAISGPWVYTGRVRHRREHEVRREHAAGIHMVAAAEAIVLARAARPRPGAGAADAGLLDRLLGDLAPARAGHAGPAVDACARPDRHPAPDPGADRRTRRPRPASSRPYSQPPRRCSTRPWPTAGQTWISPPCTTSWRAAAETSRQTRTDRMTFCWSLTATAARPSSASCWPGGGVLAPPELKQWADDAGTARGLAQAGRGAGRPAAGRCAGSGGRRAADADRGRARCCARASTTASTSGRWAARCRAMTGCRTSSSSRRPRPSPAPPTDRDPGPGAGQVRLGGRARRGDRRRRPGHPGAARA